MGPQDKRTGGHLNDSSEGSDELTFEDDLTPHAKQNMTSAFGRLVERVTYVDVILIAALVLTASTILFRFGPNGHTLKDGGASVWDCAYFAFVTFTSLGYGELAPIGFGRIVAIFDVLSGLALTAVFIGKVASERQSSLLLLLHTSDTQRRISDFASELETSRAQMQALANDRRVGELNLALESHLRLTKAMGNYLMFNAHQAVVVEFGNFTALIGLYDEIRDSFRMLERLHDRSLEIGDVMVMRRSFSNMNNLNRIVRRMGALHRRQRNRDPLWRAAIRALRGEPPVAPTSGEHSARNRLAMLDRAMRGKMAEAREWVAIGHHPIQIERVLEAFPAKPRSEWPIGLHKTIAARLKISNTVAAHCINDLIKANRLPKRSLQDEMAEPGSDAKPSRPLQDNGVG